MVLSIGNRRDNKGQRMEPILIISNLILVGLTGTYAWLANKNIKQLQQESTYYRRIVEKQLRQTALPHLYWDLQATGQALDQAVGQSNPEKQNTLALEVFNISNVPAYDVHVSLIGAYTEEALGIATFMRTHVQPRHRKYPLQSDKVGYYGVRNAVRLSLLPTQQKIVLSLPFPIQPADVYTLVQYRELSGENYYQVCCFSAIDESGAYRANILEPSEIQSMDRLHLFDVEDFALPGSLSGSNGAIANNTTALKENDPSSDTENYPYYLVDFIDLWNHSISSRLISDTPTTPEDNVPVKATYDF
ncbi:MAG: hypothetical protein AAFO84_13730 [Cyanobacteria bacterium J06598_1]